MASATYVYKHVYYFAGSDEDKIDIINDTYEVGDIGWFTYDETLKLLRSYDVSKVSVINQTYFFIVSIIEKLTIISKTFR